MKTLALALMLAAGAVAQVPMTKGSLSVQTVRINLSSMGIPDAPTLPPIMFEVWISTTNQATAQFLVSIQVKDGDTVVTQSQTVTRWPTAITFVIFRLATTAVLVAPVSVTEILAPVEF